MSDDSGLNGNGHAETVHVEQNIRQISQAKKKLSKVDVKRLHDLEERKRRLINRGVAPDKVEAAIALEDYMNLSFEEKFKRFESLTSQALQGLQKDILALQHNDGVIADAMDVNLRAVARSLQKAGVSLEDQSTIIKDVEIELRQEQTKRQEIELAAHTAELNKREEERMKTVLSAKQPIIGSNEAPEEAAHPEDATIFSDS